MQIVPAYMGLPHLFHVLCMFYVTTHTAELGILSREKGPLQLTSDWVGLFEKMTIMTGSV